MFKAASPENKPRENSFNYRGILIHLTYVTHDETHKPKICVIYLN